MTGRIAIISACYGDYDKVWPAMPQTVDADYHLFGAQADGWSTHDWPPCRQMPDVYRAKVPKMVPEYALGKQSYEYDWFIWMDASMHVTSEVFAEAMVRWSPNGWGCFKHRKRQTVKDEISHSLAWERYAGEPLWTQYAQMLRCGFLDEHLWEVPVFVRHHKFESCGWQWLALNHLWSYQDQVSLPFVFWNHKFVPNTLPGGHAFGSEWHAYHGHSSGSYGKPLSQPLHANVPAT